MTMTPSGSDSAAVPGAGLRILFVPTYRHAQPDGRARASDALGFGITCADALVAGLRAAGAQVRAVESDAARQTDWVSEILIGVERAVNSDRYDVILAFHAFWPFTADLRRILDDSTPHPLVTYTHGSHWDKTDSFRFERYPRLRWADLGNLLAADRVLVVSHYMRTTLLAAVGEVSAALAAELRRRVRVVGLPLDLPRIDAARRRRSGPPTVVFNHAPIAAKHPEVFLDVAAQALARTDYRILITRHLPAPLSERAGELSAAYPGRVILGGDLPVDVYYRALWRSHLQVSTASHESLGVATLEAMATGNHCLLPRIGAYPEVADDDPSVLYTDRADLLARLIAGPRPPVAARHAARIRRAYAPATVATAVLAVLAEVTG
jgi:glycosyltransferase involved in cell wall biosynthesis